MIATARLTEVHDFAPKETADLKSIPGGGELISSELLLPELKGGHHAPGFDAASRIAGRINAAAISKAEHDAFLSERADLLQKKYEAGLTKAESNRLEYVRWSLDRIEDAKFGADYDIFDAAVSEYESVLGEIKGLQGRIDKLIEDSKG